MYKEIFPRNPRDRNSLHLCNFPWILAFRPHHSKDMLPEDVRSRNQQLGQVAVVMDWYHKDHRTQLKSDALYKSWADLQAPKTVSTTDTDTTQNPWIYPCLCQFIYPLLTKFFFCFFMLSHWADPFCSFVWKKKTK